MKTLFTVVLLAVFVAVITVYGGLSWQRSRTIQAVSEKAREDNQGSRIEVLSSYLNSNDISFEEMNRVIWVLGELRDPSALATLQALATSEVCDHDRYVCQKEVQKAIQKVQGKLPNPYFWQKFDGV